MPDRKRVLFLCTHNAARSQMAEGLINQLLGDRFEARSAGSEPSQVHPLAIQAMSEIGIDLSQQRSKQVAELTDEKFDLVITLCQDDDLCPVWLGPGEQFSLPFPDPGRVQGSPEERLRAFRQVRDDMRQSLLEFLTARAS